MTRFHNKYHKKNHHTNSTAGYPDSASDPIASPSDPFQGDFVINGTLSASNGIYGMSVSISGDVTGLHTQIDELSTFTLALDTRVDTLSTFTLALDTRVDTLSTNVLTLIDQLSSEVLALSSSGGGSGGSSNVTNVVSGLAAGMNLSAGWVVFLTKDSIWRGTTSTAELSSKGLIGIALSSVSGGTVIDVQTSGEYQFSTSSLELDTGTLYLGAATGSLSAYAPTTEGHIARIVGYPKNADTMVIDPDQTYIEIGTNTLTSGSGGGSVSTVSSEISGLNSGNILSAGDVVHLGHTGTWLLADASEKLSAYGLVGIAKSSVAPNTALPVQIGGEYQFSVSSLEIGLTYYVSLSSGKLVSENDIPSNEGNIVRAFGYAKNADTIIIDPDVTFLEIGTSQLASTTENGFMSSSYAIKVENILNGPHSNTTDVTNLSSGNIGTVMEGTLSSTQTFYLPTTADDFSTYDGQNIVPSIDIVQIDAGLVNVSAYPGTSIIGNALTSGQGTALSIYKRKNVHTWVIVGGTT